MINVEIGKNTVNCYLPGTKSRLAAFESVQLVLKLMQIDTIHMYSQVQARFNYDQGYSMMYGK